YLDIVKKYIVGKISLTQFSNFIDERLFELRQDPDSLTGEQCVLSGIQLLLCEISDGFRTTIELEEYLKGLLSPVLTILIPGVSIESSKISTSSSNRDVDYPPVLPPIVTDYRRQLVVA
ncbi:MAG TPA: hypothetical protein VLH15_03300, partial [Dehalococcoidales bacterium]|nr:hypothetical protein [Dehalococcoidales bacterium]